MVGNLRVEKCGSMINVHAIYIVEISSLLKDDCNLDSYSF